MPSCSDGDGLARCCSGEDLGTSTIAMMWTSLLLLRYALKHGCDNLASKAPAAMSAEKLLQRCGLSHWAKALLYLI